MANEFLENSTFDISKEQYRFILGIGSYAPTHRLLSISTDGFQFQMSDRLSVLNRFIGFRKKLYRLTINNNVCAFKHSSKQRCVRFFFQT